MVVLADNHPANAPVARSTQDRTPATFPLRLVSFLLASLVLSMVIEWVCMTTDVYTHHGEQHSFHMLEREVSYLNDDFQQLVLGNSPAQVITTLAGQAYYYAFQWTGLEDGLDWLGNRLGVQAYVLASTNITQLFFVRLGILVFSLPVFMLFALLGFATGLTLRDIRRWSGGREFGGVYHLAKRWAPSALVVAWFVYLTIPISLHPNTILLPCAVLFGTNVAVVAASFKKYL